MEKQKQFNKNQSKNQLQRAQENIRNKQGKGKLGESPLSGDKKQKKQMKIQEKQKLKKGQMNIIKQKTEQYDMPLIDYAIKIDLKKLMSYKVQNKTAGKDFQKNEQQQKKQSQNSFEKKQLNIIIGGNSAKQYLSQVKNVIDQLLKQQSQQGSFGKMGVMLVATDQRISKLVTVVQLLKKQNRQIKTKNQISFQYSIHQSIQKQAVCLCKCIVAK